MRQEAPSPETHIEATAPAPVAEPLIGATTDETSSPTSDIAAPQQAATSSEPNAQVAASAPIDDTASSIPKEYASQLSTSSEVRSNAPEPAPDVSVAEPIAPLAVATVNAPPIPPDAPVDRTARRADLIDNARMLVRPFPLIFAFVLALVGLLYYVLLKCLVPGGSARTDHPEDDCIDDQCNNPEFYRKLHQGAALEKPRTPIGAA